MPKCPKCGKEISYLKEWDRGWEGFELRVDGEGIANYEKMGDFVYGDEVQYDCPECHETLFYREDDAIKFLSGKKVS